MKITIPENIIQQIINKQILNFKPSIPSPPQPPFPFQSPSQPQPPSPSQTPSQPQPPSPSQPKPISIISSSQQIQIGNFINDWLSMVQTGQGKAGSNIGQIGKGKAGSNTVQTGQEETGQEETGQEEIEIEFIHNLEHKQEHKYEYKNIVDTLIVKPKNFIFILLSVIFIILVLLLPNIFIFDDNK